MNRILEYFLLLPIGVLVGLTWANTFGESYFRFSLPLRFPVNDAMGARRVVIEPAGTRIYVLGLSQPVLAVIDIPSLTHVATVDRFRGR